MFTMKPESVTVGRLTYSDGMNTVTLYSERSPGHRVDVYSLIYRSRGRRRDWKVLFEAVHTNASGYARSLGDYDTESEAIRAGEYALGIRDTP